MKTNVHKTSIGYLVTENETPVEYAASFLKRWKYPIAIGSIAALSLLPFRSCEYGHAGTQAPQPAVDSQLSDDIPILKQEVVKERPAVPVLKPRSYKISLE